MAHGADKRLTMAAGVHEMIARIPRGRVTTYGAIARAVGLPRGARMIGWILYSVPSDLDLPCHRVVNHAGFLSGGWHFGHPDIMRGLLIEEGVPFSGEYRVDLKRCLWIPDEDDLPAADEMDDFDPVAG